MGKTTRTKRHDEPPCTFEAAFLAVKTAAQDPQLSGEPAVTVVARKLVDELSRLKDAPPLHRLNEPLPNEELRLIANSLRSIEREIRKISLHN